MSLKDKLTQAVDAAQGLLTSVTAAFPEAAAEVAENVGMLRDEMRTELTEVVGLTKERAETIVSMVADAWPWPTSTPAKAKPADEFQLFRHVRDGKINDDGSVHIAPTGGLTFFIDVKHNPQPVIAFSVSVQEIGKNFRYRLGRDVARGRFEAGQIIVGEYDTSISLLQNIQVVLDEINAQATMDIGFYKSMLDMKIDPAMLQTAANMLQVFTESLPRQYPGDPK